MGLSRGIGTEGEESERVEFKVLPFWRSEASDSAISGLRCHRGLELEAQPGVVAATVADHISGSSEQRAHRRSLVTKHRDCVSYVYTAQRLPQRRRSRQQRSRDFGGTHASIETQKDYKDYEETLPPLGA
jgi:hypothetical protein